ncbi:MAG: class A beta-lactamase [Saprospiraceae bacterium]
MFATPKTVYVRALSTYLFSLCLPLLLLAQSNLDYLQKEIARFEPLSGGKIGVGIYHIESGRTLYFNENESFPMASSFKIAIAVQLLKRVEAGQLRLDSLVSIQPTDLHPGSGTLSNLFDDPGVILSIRNLLELMLLISDNSATDVCLRLAGGADAINKMLQVNGIEDQRIDRSTLKLIADYVGVSVVNENVMTLAEFNKNAEQLTPEQQKKAADAFSKDRQDTSTPKAMTQLLLKIWQGKLLNVNHTKLLLDIMYRCQTGEARLKGLLPPGTRVAHKTGTIGGTANDVGIIELPHNAGNVIVSVFVKDSAKEIPEREKVIAHVARSVYDYFLFNPR